MAFVLTVRMTAREGEEEQAAKLIGELTQASRSEPGCNEYIPHRDPENPRVFFFYEQYRDKAAFEEHGASEHFQRIAVGQLFPLVERERNFYETLD